MRGRDLLHVFDSDHTVRCFHLDGRSEYESRLRVQAILHDSLEVTVAHESDISLSCSRKRQRTHVDVTLKICSLIGKGIVDGVAVSFLGP